MFVVFLANGEVFLVVQHTEAVARLLCYGQH